MSGNFDDIETTMRKSALIQERMSLVSNHMYKQFIEYRQANVNTSIIMDKIAENMKLTVEYLKQSFNMRGIPTQNIYFEYDKQKYLCVLNILWHTITFFADMKGTPKALERTAKDMPPLITGRIIAIKGTIKEIFSDFNNDMEQKLPEKTEVASIFIPSDKTAKAIIKLSRLSQEFPINQTEAPREFLLKVIEMVCGGGNYHNESSRVTISI